jgi:predicted transcriptional regulator
MTLQELFTAARVDVATVQRKLDVLASFGLIAVLPATTRRRLNSLVEFTELLSSKQAKRGSSPELCNHAIHFRVEPLATPALPLAPVRFVLEGTALARGLTIEEVAKEMGLARSTVSTMTKRLYRKLGVRRRAEMVTRLTENGLGD